MMNSTKLSAFIIEDELIFSTLLKNQLLKNIDSVHVFEKSEDGLENLKTHQPNLVFMDNFLPGKDGIIALKEYKELSPKSQIVLMSSALDIPSISEAISNGADYLLNKKVDLQESLDPILKNCQKTFYPTLDDVLLTDYDPLNYSDDVIRIAVLEDEETFSAHINWILNSILKKSKITSFKNVVDFVESLVKEDRYDFIFSDYYLIDGTIKTVMPVIKGKVPDAKILVFSAKADVNEAVEIKNLGIDLFIEKDENWQVHFLNALTKFQLT